MCSFWPLPLKPICDPLSLDQRTLLLSFSIMSTLVLNAHLQTDALITPRWSDEKTNDKCCCGESILNVLICMHLKIMPFICEIRQLGGCLFLRHTHADEGLLFLLMTKDWKDFKPWLSPQKCTDIVTIVSCIVEYYPRDFTKVWG